MKRIAIVLLTLAACGGEEEAPETEAPAEGAAAPTETAVDEEVEPEADEPDVATVADFEAEASDEITADNLESEVSELEDALDEDLGEE